jgi:hypothetical protein
MINSHAPYMAEREANRRRAEALVATSGRTHCPLERRVSVPPEIQHLGSGGAMVHVGLVFSIKTHPIDSD